MSVQKTLEGWFPNFDWATYFPFYEIFKEFFPLALTILLFVFGIIAAKRKFGRHTYYDVVTYSLNGFGDSTVSSDKTLLAFRTQLECKVADIFPDDKKLIAAIEKAAKECSKTNMFMLVNGTPRTQEIFLNGISSQWIAKVGAEGDLVHTARRVNDLQLEFAKINLIKVNFWIGVTFEPYEAPPIRKIRVMIIAEEDLEKRDFVENKFDFENPSHYDRIHTLRTMQQLYRDPSRRDKYLIKREITLVV